VVRNTPASEGQRPSLRGLALTLLEAAQFNDFYRCARAALVRPRALFEIAEFSVALYSPTAAHAQPQPADARGVLLGQCFRPDVDWSTSSQPWVCVT
jgi:hypothetical protein